ncbi:hypothetical protein C8J57DRAFT_1245396 [Mycena rebaudengoi]|nr:hypothetical protein C8J57DRAFT_1245396 [Mycena rebaudengoi]
MIKSVRKILLSPSSRLFSSLPSSVSRAGDLPSSYSTIAHASTQALRTQEHASCSQIKTQEVQAAICQSKTSDQESPLPCILSSARMWHYLEAYFALLPAATLQETQATKQHFIRSEGGPPAPLINSQDTLPTFLPCLFAPTVREPQNRNRGVARSTPSLSATRSHSNQPTHNMPKLKLSSPAALPPSGSAAQCYAPPDATRQGVPQDGQRHPKTQAATARSDPLARLFLPFLPRFLTPAHADLPSRAPFLVHVRIATRNSMFVYAGCGSWAYGLQYAMWNILKDLRGWICVGQLGAQLGLSRRMMYQAFGGMNQPDRVQLETTCVTVGGVHKIKNGNGLGSLFFYRRWKKKNGPHTTVFQRVPLSGAARALPARAAYSIPDLPTWHTPRVVLIRDAAHGLPPNGGMGFGVGVISNKREMKT